MPVIMNLLLVLAIAAAGLFAAALVQVIHLSVVLAWSEEKTKGSNYFGLPPAERQRFKRTLQRNRRLLAPTVWLLRRMTRFTFDQGSFSFDGVAGPRGTCSAESFGRGADYVPRPCDVFVVTQMRCGTTLMQHLVLQVLSRGTCDLVEQGTTLHAVSPWLESFKTVEIDLAPLVGTEKPRRIVKTHFPARLCPFNRDARYIYVVRHPVSCFASCIDYVSHNVPGFAPPEGEFEAWFRSAERMWWGTWPDHVAGWWNRAAENDNMLIVRFEDVTGDLRAVAQTLAGFLDQEPLASGELDQIEHKCSFRYMHDHAEVFDMTPPHLLQSSGKFFFSGKADRYQNASPEVRQRINQWCRDTLPEAVRQAIGYADLL